jgi:hypothetical protein
MIDGDDLAAAIQSVGINDAMEPWKTRLSRCKSGPGKALASHLEASVA